jgi:mRNA interferase RelE/StbE
MSKISAYAKNPGSQANNVKRLKGSPAVFRLRVGEYRVIFTERGDAIVVTKIGPRGSIYDQGSGR